jgi:hypothetical protein
MKTVLLVLVWLVASICIGMVIASYIASGFNIRDHDILGWLAVGTVAVVFFVPVYFKRMTPNLDVKPTKKPWY